MLTKLTSWFKTEWTRLHIKENHWTHCSCGCKVTVVYTDDIKWTGKCKNCGSILQFIESKEVHHGHWG